MEINQEKCACNKRRLVLDCSVEGTKYLFSYDDWGDTGENISLKVGDEEWKPDIIVSYKHCIQASFPTKDDDRRVFIDRRYEHNSEFDVYFAGKAYHVKTPESI